MVGALAAGAFVKFGKLKMIVVMNCIFVASVCSCMVENIYVIAVGRFFWGVCAGAFTVFSPKYLNEFVPLEYRGMFGGIANLMLTIGLAIPAVLSINLEVDPVAALKKNPNDFFVTQYWRIIWLVPAVLATI